MAKKPNTILQRQLQVRTKLWPDVSDDMLWGGEDTQGFSMVPRVMPLMMSIMDDLSGKGFPVGQTYFEMWCRLREEGFLTLNRPEEMAFHAGYSGQRALRTWKDRVRRLANLGFIDVVAGPVGDLSYAIFFNPYHVLKRHHVQRRINNAKWQALVIRSLEIGAFDLDEVDDEGQLVASSRQTAKPDADKAIIAGTSSRQRIRKRRKIQTLQQLSESS